MKRHIVMGPGTKILRLGGKPSGAVLWLLIVQVGLFIAYAFADGPKWVDQGLAASAKQALGHFHFWQPLTALWIHVPDGVHPGVGIQNLLFDGVVLWLFGSALQRWWGSRRFFTFWVVTGVVGLVAGVLFGMLQPNTCLSGSLGSTAAMLVAVSFIFPHHLLQFTARGVLPLKARVISLVMAGILVVGSLAATRFLEVPVELFGAAAGLLFVFNPKRLLAEARVKRAKKKLGVIDGGKKGNKYVN